MAHSAFDREPQPEGPPRLSASDWVGFAVWTALRSVECAGFPANAGGTAEASSFVPIVGEKGVFLFCPMYEFHKEK